MRCRAFLWRNVKEPGVLEIHGDKCEKLTSGTDQADDLQEVWMKRYRIGTGSDELLRRSRYRHVHAPRERSTYRISDNPFCVRPSMAHLPGGTGALDDAWNAC
jgi:hypothetical protein